MQQDVPQPVVAPAQVELGDNVGQNEPKVVLVNRNQNKNELYKSVQQNNFGRKNNLAHMVETILAQNGFNTGLHRPNFVPSVSVYVMQTELPRG